MGKMNKKWHEQNKMPKNPTELQRIEWHLEHVKNCNCRPIPQGIVTSIKARGMTLPKKALQPTRQTAARG
jgi:hypothetical protein